jgi:hypothetical protein
MLRKCGSFLVPILMAILVGPLSAQTSIPQTIADSVGDTLRYTEGQLLSIADADSEPRK